MNLIDKLNDIAEFIVAPGVRAQRKQMEITMRLNKLRTGREVVAEQEHGILASAEGKIDTTRRQEGSGAPGSAPDLSGATRPDASLPSKERAAQIWCEPQHGKKVMDSEFATSIAFALDEVRAAERATFVRYEQENQLLLKRIKIELEMKDNELRVLRAEMSVFRTMQDLHRRATQHGGLMSGDAHIGWEIENMLRYGTPHPASEGRSTR